MLGFTIPLIAGVASWLASVSTAGAQDISSFNTLQTASPATIEHIKILRPKFAWRRFLMQKYGGLDLRVISFTLENNSPIAIQRVRLGALLRLDGRPVPLAAQDFDYSIPGGLLPRESKHFDLDADMFVDWPDVGKQDVRKATFTLMLRAVDDAKGERIVR